MKFLLSDEARYIADILAETGCLSISQIHRLLRLVDSETSIACAKAVAGQLCYSNNALRLSEDIYTPLFLDHRETDPDMLIAVDIMLDLLCEVPKALSAKRPPFKLCFLTGNDSTTFAVAVVHPGEERELNAFFETCTDELTVIFLVSESEQVKLIKTGQPHYFAVMDGKRRRYFKGS